MFKLFQMHCVFIILVSEIKRIYTLNHVTNFSSIGSVSPIKNNSTECLFLGEGPSQSGLLTLKNIRQTTHCSNPKAKLPLLFSCPSMIEWSIALIYEWLVDFSHFWHNPKLSKYNEYEVTRRQESLCSWKNTERLIRLRNLRILNTETSSDSSHFVIRFSSHLALKKHIHKRCHLMN